VNTGVIVQARMGSTRLPGKVMADLGGLPAIARVLRRVKRIPGVGPVILATSDRSEDGVVAGVATDEGVLGYRGDPYDVLNRYVGAAEAFDLDVIVRVTGDCPMLDPTLAGRVVEAFHRGTYDYYSNVHPATYPDGLDVEVVTRRALLSAWNRAKGVHREHVTSSIWSDPARYTVGNLANATDLSRHRWTLDTKGDLEFIRKVYRDLGPDFTTQQVLDLPYSHTLPRTVRL
jgi:spore coat polysaccharide biosynthesis protein SpsF (cytidylyltransferase family)